MKRMCMHGNAHAEGKGREGKGREGNGTNNTPAERDERKKNSSLQAVNGNAAVAAPPSSARPPKPRTPRVASSDGIEFAAWFRAMLPEDVRLSENWENAYGLVYDDLIRLDKRTHEDIVAVCQWAREDRFWAAYFQSPTKLRDRDQQGAQYYDVFQARMKAASQPPTKKPRQFSGMQENIEILPL